MGLALAKALIMELQPIHPEPTSFAKKWLFSTDHKVIAKQFLWAGLAFLAIGGTLAMTIRWQWAHPGEKVPVIGALVFHHSAGAVTPEAFNKMFTMHGLIMVFWAITPIIIGAFGNFCIPLMIGARDMAFPKLNMYSFWVFVLSGIIVLAAFFVPLGPAGAGWTTYPPLSGNTGMPGAGQSLVVLGLFVTGVATIMGGINYITTVIRFRAPGMGWMRMPLTVWGLWLTSILNVLWVPVLGAGGLILLLDRVFGTHIFVAGALAGNNQGDPMLFQHLFWLFGHPEVYILILPAWGIIGDLLSFFARKPAYWYKGSVYAMVAVTLLSGVVYGHHMYVTGMSPVLGLAFEALTLSISAPAVILFVNWLNTIWRGSIRLTPPMIYSLGVVWVFGVGGLTGLPLGTISTDLYLHDTLWVVGHFHLTMGAATLLASFAAIHFWFPKMFGRRMSDGLGSLHAWVTIACLTVAFCVMILTGYYGQHRRLFDPYQFGFIQNLLPLNRLTSYIAFALGASQAIFAINFIKSIFVGEQASDNPWEVGTLEWTIPSPPPHHNFDVVPVVRCGPHELSNPDVEKRLGRDWIAQTESIDEAPDDSEVAATNLEPASA